MEKAKLRRETGARQILFNMSWNAEMNLEYLDGLEMLLNGLEILAGLTRGLWRGRAVGESQAAAGDRRAADPV